MVHATTHSLFNATRSRPGFIACVYAVITIIALWTGVRSVHAREVQAATSKSNWEFVTSSGAFIPTGVQRSIVKTGNVSTAQLAYVVNPSLALTTTVGWARSREVATPGSKKFDVFTYDLGVEARLPRVVFGGIKSFAPFAGAGMGARSYNYRNTEESAAHNMAAFGSAGGEVGARPVRLRVEVRDYVTRFRGLNGEGASSTRNDVVVTAGLRIAKRK